MNFDFFGIPIDGTPPQFVERLLRNGRLDKTRGIENDFDSYSIQVYMPELFCDSIPLIFTYNTYTQMVYDATIYVHNDIGLSNYSRFFDIIVERYGSNFVKLPKRESITWHFVDGDIQLFRDETTTILSFTDNANDPNNPDNQYDDLTDEDEQKLID